MLMRNQNACLPDRHYQGRKLQMEVHQLGSRLKHRFLVPQDRSFRRQSVSESRALKEANFPRLTIGAAGLLGGRIWPLGRYIVGKQQNPREENAFFLRTRGRHNPLIVLRHSTKRSEKR